MQLDLSILEEKGKELLLKDETIELAKDFAIKYLEKTHRKQNNSMMAAFLYIAAIHKNYQYGGERRNQIEVADACGVSVRTVCRWYKDVADKIDCDITPEMMTRYKEILQHDIEKSGPTSNSTSKENICRLSDDPGLIVAPHDKGEPPSWVPALHGEQIVWVDREIFDKLKELRNKKPCNICPKEINEKCGYTDKMNVSNGTT